MQAKYGDCKGYPNFTLNDIQLETKVRFVFLNHDKRFERIGDGSMSLHC
jgi:hypothetical protein